MKRKIRNVLQAMVNGLQAEHAGVMISTRCKSELLQNKNQQAQTTELPDQTA